MSLKYLILYLFHNFVFSDVIGETTSDACFDIEVAIFVWNVF